MHDFTRLRVWQRARSLTGRVHRITAAFPRREVFGLSAQMRRSAVSIGANLADGAGRATAKDFAHFTTMAIGSLNELEHHSFIAADLGFIEGEELAFLRREIREVRSMTLAFRRTLKRRI